MHLHCFLVVNIGEQFASKGFGVLAVLVVFCLKAVMQHKRKPAQKF